MTNVERKSMPALRVAAVHHVGPYDQISKAFAKLGAIVGPAGLFHRDNAAMIALFHNDPKTAVASDLQSDAGLLVDDSVQLPAGVTEIRVAAGNYAVLVHVGAYTGLPAAWAALMASGKLRPGGVTFELYRNDPGDTPTEQLITELYLAVE